MSLAQLFYLKESLRRRARRTYRQKPSSPRASHFMMESLEPRLLLSATPVAPDLSSIITNATNLEPNPITQAASPNQTVSVQLDYQDTGSGTGTTGLGLRIHYNSHQLRPGEAGSDGQFGTSDDVASVTNLISAGPSTIVQGIQDQADSGNFDGDASTDRFILVAWTDFTGAFPKGPAELLISNWTTTADFTSTAVNFTTSSRPVGRALNATSADITLENTTTGPVALTRGVTATGTVSATGETDLYTFTGAAGDVVAITLAGTPNTPFNAVASLFGPTGTLVQSNLVGQQEFALATAGTYVLKVSDRNFIFTGDYGLEVEGITPPSANAVTLTRGETQNTNIAQMGETDLYTFTAQAGDVVAITLAGTPNTPFNAVASLFGPTGTLVQSNLVGQQEFALATAGTYVLKVSDRNFVITGNYQLTVNADNQAPVLGPIGNKTVSEGEPLTFTVNATDADIPAQPLTFSASGLPTGATFDPTTRTFSWTPTEAQGPNTFTGITFTVEDGQGGTDSETISITVNEVNQAPVLGTIGNKTVTVGQPLTFTVTATDTDLPANVLTFSSTTLPAGASFDATTGQFSWTPVSGQLGQTNLIFTVQDNGTPPLSDSEPVTITVRAEPNANPVAVNDGVYAATEDQLLTVAAAQGVLANDSDPNTDALSATLLTQAAHGVVTLESDGGFTYQPSENFNGNDSFTYQVSDGRGGTASATVNLTVAPVNDAPVLGAIGNKTVQVGQPLTFTINATDADVPANALTFSATSLPTGATFDAATGQFSWTPTAGQVGDAEMTFAVQDDGSPQLGNSETITINVTPIPNRNPVADDDSYTIGQDQVLNIAAPGVLEGDTDADGDELSIVATDVTGLQGEVLQVTDGSFIFTPTAGFTGTTSYSYTVGDLVGGTDTGTVTITVEPVDAAPTVTVNQMIGQADPTNTSPILFDVVFSEAVTGFDATDISFAGSTVNGPLVATITGNGSIYEVAVSGMTSNGDVVASIVAGAGTDAGGNTNAASTSTDNSVTFTGIDPHDEAPTVRMEQGGAQEDPTSQSPIWFDVTFSEPVTGFGPEDISFAGSTVSGQLTAEVLGSGSTYLVLVSGMTSSGIVVASVLAGGATDATGHLNSASTGPDNGVTFVVSNTAPIVSSFGTILEENSTAGTEVGVIPATDPDPGQTLTFSILGGNESGTFAIDSSSGRVTVANSAGLDFETTAHFTLTVQALDNGVPALSASSTFDIQLLDVNEPPKITVPSTKAIPENTTTVATVTANDPDAGRTLSFNLSGVDAAKFRLDGTGNSRTLRFVNAPDFERPTDTGRNNVYNLTVTVSDGSLSESKSIAVTVTDVKGGGSTPFVIKGTQNNDRIVVKEGVNDRLSVTVNHKTSHVHLQRGQAIQVLGLGGNDRIVLDGLKHTVLADGGAGHDIIDASRVTSSRASLVLRGGTGGDLLVGGLSNDRLEGGNGEDILVGNKGNDRLLGGNGKDLLIGGLGNDKLEGNDGSDALLGGPGRDQLYGGKGNDVLIRDIKDSVADGGPGNDRILTLGKEALAMRTQTQLLSGQPAWLRQFVG
ncbi:MAG: tandem-95 repeat protein [Nitrospira sp.]